MDSVPPRTVPGETREKTQKPETRSAQEFPPGWLDRLFDSPQYVYHVIGASEIPSDDPKRPQVFMDNSGQPVLDAQGNPILRPHDLPPQEYVQAGRAAHYLAAEIHQFSQAVEAVENGHLKPSALIGLSAEITMGLSPFTHGGALDAERFGQNYVRDYRHYTSIATGIFVAAAGIDLDEFLSIADSYAALKSKFSRTEHMDDRFTHSTRQDVDDTIRGYRLYESGRISAPN